MNTKGFNVGVAVRYGVDAAIIADTLIMFCKCFAKVEDYRRDGKVVIPKDDLHEPLASFMNRRQYNEGIRKLIDAGIIGIVDTDLLYFTDKAKDIFRKKPIRILITWQ